MPTFSAIQREDVLAAIRSIDSGAPHGFGAPSTYLLVHDGHTYPPKAVVGVAHATATGTPLGPGDFGGGVAGANLVLSNLGFDIETITQEFDPARWWLFAAGEDGGAWQSFRDNRWIAHRGGGLGDLRDFESQVAMEAALTQISPSDQRPTNDARGNWDWVHEMQKGDIVIAKRGRDRLLGVGKIRSDYQFAPSPSDLYAHQRRVAWLWIGDEPAPSGDLLPIKTLTNIGHRTNLISFARSLAESRGFAFAVPPSTRLVVGQQYTRADVRRLLGLPYKRGGPWDTGYVRHKGAWYLFPNIGIPGRTGHDYGNSWEGDRLRWFAKNHTNTSQPAIRDLLGQGTNIQLFSRSADRDPFTYHGRVGPAQVLGGTPVQVIWDLIDRPVVESVPLPEELDEAETYTEGAVRKVTINAYERSDDARRACIEHWGTACTACGLSMETRYGPLARGFIHVHHLRSLAEIREEYEVDPIHDLRPVCPNCHAIIHLGRPFLGIDALKELLALHSLPA